MCWIAVLFRVNPHYPVIVAANREESRQRPSQAPFRWAGRVRPYGRVATNWAEVPGWGSIRQGFLPLSRTDRVTTTMPPGHLVGCFASEAFGAIHQGQHARSSSMSSPCADSTLQSALRESTSRDGLAPGKETSETSQPGVHILSNDGDIDDDTLPVVREVRGRIESLDLASPVIDDLFGSLGSVCANTDQPFPLCRVGGDYGTVSSSLVAVKADGTVAAYWHAPGPPSEVAFAPVTLSSEERQPRTGADTDTAVDRVFGSTSPCGSAWAENVLRGQGVDVASELERPSSCPGRGPQGHEQLLKNSSGASPETCRDEDRPYFTPKSWSHLGTETVTRSCFSTSWVDWRHRLHQR